MSIINLLKDVLNSNKSSVSESNLEHHFSEFRKNVVGLDQTFMSPYGEKNHLC